MGASACVENASAATAIDDIFADAKKRKVDKEKAEAEADIAEKKQKSKALKKKGIRPGGRISAPSLGSADNPLVRGDEWVDDGLGGIYNAEGWTGRHTPNDSMRIFKAHLIKVGAGGGTPLCPFDCQCCF